MKPKKVARTNTVAPRRWSRHVTETSDAMDLDEGVFRQRSARAIAASLSRSAERSRRRKSDAFRSAMSMLTFYVNRAGKELSSGRKRVLEAAKNELRSLYGRERSTPRKAPAARRPRAPAAPLARRRR
ncbi:MAG TPA: DUF3175 domain-containing protein [Polyangiaceae bacterium]|jgi:hypothetical protein|nr:DUF3175 domain-containing protein [Polyangiaceae bacterium]